MLTIGSIHFGHSGHKKASRVARLAMQIPTGMRSGNAWAYDAGSNTVSTTWITPFD
jgi:hypothetical protein